MNGIQPLVTVDDVFKIYREGDVETVALRGATMRLERGEFVAIVGRSGSGKSTLLNIIGGLAEPTAGRALVAGVDVSRADEDTRAHLRRKCVGIVFQSENLVPFLTAEENVALALQLAGTSKSMTKARELLNLLSVDHRRGNRPEQLSGGEKQRVAIATALANEPELLLADEITGELDTGNADSVLEELARLNARGTAILAVTHNPRVAERAHRVLHIADGRIVGSESADSRNA